MGRIEQVELERHRDEITGNVKHLVEKWRVCSTGTCPI
jgi:hypothetical protein